MKQNNQENIEKEKLLIIDKELKKTNPVYITVNRIVSKIKLSILAEKLIRAIASNISEGNCTNLNDLSIYTNIETSINTKTFCELFNYKNDNNFTVLADAREELQKTGFTLPGKTRPTDSLIAKSYVKNGNMYFQVSPLVLPYYVAKGIDYELGNILNFKNVNTFRFYEYLLDKLQNDNRIEIILSLTETKELLNIKNKYNRYIDLKNKVLIPILNDINKTSNEQENFCNIRLEITTLKTGKKITDIKLTVTRTEPKIIPVVSLNLIKDKLTNEGRVAYDFFQYTSNNGLLEIDDCVRDYGEKKLIQVYEYVKYQYEHKKIKTSLKAYAANALRYGWCDPDLVKPKKQIKGASSTKVELDEPQETITQEKSQQEDFNEKILKKLCSMSMKEQEKLFEKTLNNCPNKTVFAYQLLSSKSYEDVIQNVTLTNLYIRTLKEQKFVDILMDEF